MDAFWQAVAEHDWTPPDNRLEFRLYYDSHGNVIYYSMEDLPGDYIIVDRLTFDQARFDIKVRDGKIIKARNPASWKLKPCDQGDYACHPADVTIVVSKDYHTPVYWRTEITHEAD